MSTRTNGFLVRSENQGHKNDGISTGISVLGRSDLGLTSQTMIHLPPSPAVDVLPSPSTVAKVVLSRRSRWGTPIKSSETSIEGASVVVDAFPAHFHEGTSSPQNWQSSEGIPRAPSVSLTRKRRLSFMEGNDITAVDLDVDGSVGTSGLRQSIPFVSSVEGAFSNVRPSKESSQESLKCSEDKSPQSPALDPETVDMNSAKVDVLDDLELAADRRTSSGGGSITSDDIQPLSLAATDSIQQSGCHPAENPNRSFEEPLAPTTESSSIQKSDTANRLRLAKMKLHHARLQVATALTRQQTLSVSSMLPPITALSQPLLVNNILSYNQELVCFLPMPVILETLCDMILPDDVDDEKVVPNDLHQKSKALQKNLLLLRKKKLELTLRLHQQRGKVSPPPAEEAKELLVINKDTLKKRQEELQQKVDAAYWKRLVIKQRNLLAAEQNEVLQYDGKLQSCQEEIRNKESAILECERSINESMIREKCLETMIQTSARMVLAARKRRHELQIENEMQNASKPLNHPVIDVTAD